jgi:hypothetical protein
MKACIVMAGVALLLAGKAAAHGGLADVSVFDRTEGRRLAVYWHQGRAYMAGKPGNEYQVTVRNRLREEVLAVVSVDGVNVISGETADAGQSGYILSPLGAYDIQGWRKSLAETAAFYFTALPDSYAARTGRAQNAGVIGVAIFRKKRMPQPITPDLGQAAPAPAAAQARREALNDAAAGARSAEPEVRLGTGHGRREASYVQYVDFERASSMPAQTITLYYDSYRNLVARGIIRDPVPVAPLPQPFPGSSRGFVPDPQG